MSESSNRAKGLYRRILEHLFVSRYVEGITEIPFNSSDIVGSAEEIGVQRPANPPDVLYSMRYRRNTPPAISATEPEGKVWIIRGTGRGQYSFNLVTKLDISPNPLLAETKVPDATPGIVTKYSLSDEQALLVKLRYNRLIDIFTGITCYSLQNHLRTAVPGMGQVETDEIYVGVDKRGIHYVFPVQAKGGKDRLGIVQIEQDFALCAHKFSTLICRAIAAQFMEDDLIALFEFEESESGVALTSEKHYRLVPPDEITPEDLRAYQERSPNS